MKPRLPIQLVLLQGNLFEASIAGLEQAHGVCDLQISSYPFPSLFEVKVLKEMYFDPITKIQGANPLSMEHCNVPGCNTPSVKFTWYPR